MGAPGSPRAGPGGPGVLAAVEPVLSRRVEEGPQPHEVADDLSAEAGFLPGRPAVRGAVDPAGDGCGEGHRVQAEVRREHHGLHGAGRQAPARARKVLALVLRHHEPLVAGHDQGRTRPLQPMHHGPRESGRREGAAAVPGPEEALARPGVDGRVGGRPAREQEGPDALRERHRNPGLAEVFGAVEAVVPAQPDLVGEGHDRPRGPEAVEPHARGAALDPVPGHGPVRRAPQALGGAREERERRDQGARLTRALLARARRGREERERSRDREQEPSHLAKYGRRRKHACSGSSGMTRVPATTVMKFVSPVQRGTRCMWMWSATPAPADLPRFIPTLMPSGL